MTDKESKNAEPQAEATEDREGEVAAEEVEEQAEVVEREQEEIAEREEGPPGPGELERLRGELEEAKTQAAEYLDGWQRTQAEFSNYKKRQQAERVQITKLANATLLRKLLPVLDDFERALASRPSGLDQLTWCEGISLIKHKLDAIIESEGVEPIEAAGETFNPRYHEAVTYEEVSGYEDGQIIAEVQRGYTLDDRVLRPALVRVAKASAPEPEEDNDTSENEE